MANPLYQAMNGNRKNLFQMIQQARQNPMSVISQRFNLPQGLNDPQSIMNYLVQSGQVPQARINQAYQIAQQMGFKK